LCIFGVQLYRVQAMIAQASQPTVVRVTSRVRFPPERAGLFQAPTRLSSTTNSQKHTAFQCSVRKPVSMVNIVSPAAETKHFVWHSRKTLCRIHPAVGGGTNWAMPSSIYNWRNLITKLSTSPSKSTYSLE
jgi:hypothetical protein